MTSSVPPSVAYPTAGPKTTAGLIPGATTGVLSWALVRETADAPAVVRLWDSTSAGSAPCLWDVSLGGGESREDNFLGGKTYSTGLYLEIVSGAVEVSIGKQS